MAKLDKYRDLFGSAKAVARKCDRLIVFISAGKDSAVMLNILLRYMKPERLHVYHMYYFKPILSFHKKYFDMLERKYGIKVNYIAHYDLQNKLKSRKRTRKLKQSDTENYLRSKHDTKWCVWGYRKDESLERRGMMAHLNDGIDYQNGKVYPLIEWNNPSLQSYIVSEKIPLSIEYRYGLRDMTILKNEQVLWLKNNYPEDFENLSKVYPELKAELLRLEEELF